MFSIEEKIKHIRLAELPEANMQIPKIGSGTFEDLRNALRNALKNLYPGSYPVILSTYKDRVIVEIDQLGKILIFEIPYKVEKGVVTLGSPVEVKKKVTFVKAESRAGSQQLTELQRWEQRMAGQCNDDTAPLSEREDGKIELCESLFDDGSIKILHEEILLEGKVKKAMIIQGIAAKADEINDNGRLYPKSVLSQQVAALQSKVKEGALLSELDHPMPVGTHGRLGHTAAKVTDLSMDNNDLVFKAEVLPTPKGDILQNLIKSGCRIGVSTRGFGDWQIERRNGKEVKVIKDDFELVGLDFVSEPSCSAAKVLN